MYNNKYYIVMLSTEFILPEAVYYHVGHNEVGWRSDGEYYWLNGFWAEPKEPWRWAGHWPINCDFDRFFEDKLYATEPFKFSIEIWYHFDNEPEKHVVLNYTVEPREVDEAQRKRGAGKRLQK